MGGSQSKSPLKEESSCKSNSKENSPVKEIPISKNESPSKPAPPTTSASATDTTTPVNSTGDTVSSVQAPNIVTPTKAPAVIAGDQDEPSTPTPAYKVSDAELASIEAVAKTLRDTTGGKSIEIVLSPAVKKVGR